MERLRVGVRAATMHPDLRTELQGASQLGDLAERVPIFARDDVGQQLEPITTSARQLLDGPGGERLRGILDGAVRIADERPGSKLRGVVLPDDPDALQGWQRLRSIGDDVSGMPGWFDEFEPFDHRRLTYDFDARQAAAFPMWQRTPPVPAPAGGGESAVEQYATAAAHFDDGFVVALEGPHAGIGLLFRNDVAARSAAFESVLLRPDTDVSELVNLAMPIERARAQGLKTFVHEIEHGDGVSYATDDLVARTVEEGGDQAITMWPGRLERAVDELGLADEVPRSEIERMRPFDSYPAEHAAVLDNLRRATIDPTDSNAFADAVTLLRGRKPTPVVVDDLAAAIANATGRMDRPARAATREQLEASLRVEPSA